MSDPDRPGRLTPRDYWEGLHRAPAAPGGGEPRRGPRSALQGLLGPSAAAFLHGGGHRQYLIDEVLLAPYVPSRPGWSLLEVGSAPGRRLLHLSRRFGCLPFGVDFSAPGVEASRRAFVQAGFDPENVLLADFLLPDFQRARRESFDVVFSIGLVEHFEDARTAVAAHAALVRPGGLLVVAIPNLLGVNRWLTRRFDPDALDRHNLAIMRRGAFEGLFEGLGLIPLFGGYVGTFPLGLLHAPAAGWRRRILRAGWRVEALAELALWALLGTRHPRARWISPYLAYVGRRPPAP